MKEKVVKLRLCAEHWDGLRAALDARGLGQFISADEGAAGKRLASGAYEPMGRAAILITKHAIGVAGPLMVDSADDETCPLCFVIRTCPCGRGDECDMRGWIDKAADGQLRDAHKLGLVAAA